MLGCSTPTAIRDCVPVAAGGAIGTLRCLVEALARDMTLPLNPLTQTPHAATHPTFAAQDPTPIGPPVATPIPPITSPIVNPDPIAPPMDNHTPDDRPFEFPTPTPAVKAVYDPTDGRFIIDGPVRRLTGRVSTGVVYVNTVEEDGLIFRSSAVMVPAERKALRAAIDEAQR